MIRLRPSELTLTPDDVEQTFRRIAQRQTSIPSLVASSRSSAQPGRPLLRRGPQRSTRDAITILGDIPILRPQSQRAVYDSLDEDIDDTPAPLTDRRDSVTGTSPSLHGHITSARASIPSAIRTLHLPFRLGRNRQSTSVQSIHSEHTIEVNAPPPVEAELATIDGSETLDGTDALQGILQSEFIIASDTHAELRGGGRPGKERADSATRDASRSPSPPLPQSRPPPPPLLQQMQTPKQRIFKIKETEGDPPTKLLRGNFSGTGTEYSFEEFDLSYPYTEPPLARDRGRSSGRWPSLRRSRSGGSVLALATPARVRDWQRRIPPRQGTFQDSERPQHERPRSSSVTRPTHQNRPRSRQVGTSSSSSAPFSYYGSELVPSQNTSRETSAVGVHGGSERNGALGQNRVPSAGSSNSLRGIFPVGQFGVSPLPSSPYMRGQVTQGGSQTSTSSNIGRSTLDGHVDAATAAAQNRDSPLGGYSDQYQNLARGIPGRQTIPTQPNLSHPHGSLGSNSSRQGGGVPQQAAPPNPYQNPYLYPYQHQYQNPYRNPYQNPYQTPYQIAHQTPYSGPYSGPYQSPYQGPYQPPHQTAPGPPSMQQQHHLAQQHHLTQQQQQREQHDWLQLQRHMAQQQQRREQRELQRREIRQQFQQQPPQQNRPQRSSQHSSDHSRNTSGQVLSSIRTDAHAPRATQRSSENVPVDPASTGERTSQVQTQTAAYELLHNAAQASQPSNSRQPDRGSSRLSAPPPALPRDISNGPRSQPPQQPAPRAPYRHPNARMSGSPQPPSTAQEEVHNEPSMRGGAPVLPRHTSRHHSADRPLRTHGRTFREPTTTAAPPLHLRPTRSPLTALALDHGGGTTTRPTRSPLVRAGAPVRTQRRIPARQRNQENSGEVELTAIRREEAAILSRYSEEERGEVMDETPPRVGRVERRMFE